MWWRRCPQHMLVMCPMLCWMFVAWSWVHDFALASACVWACGNFPAKHICSFPALVLLFVGFKWCQVKLKGFNKAKQKWWWNEAMGIQGKTRYSLQIPEGKVLGFIHFGCLRMLLSSHTFQPGLPGSTWSLVTFSFSPSPLGFYPPLPATISWFIFFLEAILHLSQPCLPDMSLLLSPPPTQNLIPLSHISPNLYSPLCRDKL